MQHTEKARSKREAASAEAERRKSLYNTWRAKCAEDFASMKTLKTFPHIPVSECTCNETLCQIFKSKELLKACVHDVGRFLRLSEQYSADWLRVERNEWHPDKFGRRCDPEFLSEIQQKGAMMFTMYGQLITSELGR